MVNHDLGASCVRPGARALHVVLCLLCVLCLLSVAAPSTPRRRSRKPKRAVQILTGPVDDDAHARGLLDQYLTADELVETGRQYRHPTQERKTKGSVLAYVTPWHARGYEAALTWRSQLTHVAPVWYQLRAQSGVLHLDGRHEFNATWAAALRAPGAHEGGGAVRLVPRVIVELGGQDMVSMVSSESTGARSMLVQEVQAKDYDGLVLEVWVSWVAMNGLSNDGFREAAFAFLRALADDLHALKPPRELIVAVPPALPSGPGAPYIEVPHFAALRRHVDAWSVMTYDFSAGRAGPNAPLTWLQRNVHMLLPTDEERAEFGPKVLVGVNFYGYHSGGKAGGGAPVAVVADAFLQLLSKRRATLRWDEQSQEHVAEFEAGSRAQAVWFPTPASLHKRVALANEEGVGLSIWELGQGLESFFDVL